MLKKLVIATVAVFTLAACGTGNEQPNDAGLNEEGALKELNVDILTAEDAFEPGEEGKVEVKVTEDTDPVPDADEVLFEVWKHGEREAAEKIDGEHEGDGIYSLTYTFEEGYYYVIPHVTARGKHTMPKQAFNVGDVEVPEEPEEDDHDHGHM